MFRVPVYLPYLQPKLTPPAIARAEAKLGVKLPASYLALLREQNGGYLRRTNHPSDRAPVSDIAGIGPNFPSILRRDWSDVTAYMAEQDLSKPANLEALLPFCGDGHYYWCFDYRLPGEPRITYIDVETFDVDEVVAPDFATFLTQLRAEPETVRALETHVAGKTVARALSAASRFDFVDGGDQNNGYRTFRARLPGKTNWAWLSANRCRRGFVRKTDERYTQLSKLMRETVGRYPEHPDCGWFLSSNAWDSAAGKALVRALSKVPYASREVTLV